MIARPKFRYLPCVLSDTESAHSSHISNSEFWPQTKAPFLGFHLMPLLFLFLPIYRILICTFPIGHVSYLLPHPASQSLGLIGIRHASGDKVGPARGSIFLAHCHCPVCQHRHSPSNPSTRLVPPALRTYGKQSPRQVLHAQTRERRAHRKPHVWGSGLTGGPGGTEDQLGLLLRAVQQTHLGGQKVGREGTGPEEDTHTYTLQWDKEGKGETWSKTEVGRSKEGNILSWRGGAPKWERMEMDRKSYINK